MIYINEISRIYITNIILFAQNSYKQKLIFQFFFKNLSILGAHWWVGYSFKINFVFHLIWENYVRNFYKNTIAPKPSVSQTTAFQLHNEDNFLSYLYGTCRVRLPVFEINNMWLILRTANLESCVIINLLQFLSSCRSLS